MPTQQDVWHRSNCKLDIWGFESRRASWCFVWRDPMSSGPHQGLSPNYKSYIESDWDSQRWCIQCIQSLLMWLKVCTASQLSPLFEQSFAPIPKLLAIWVEDATQTHGHTSDDGQRRHLQGWEGRPWIKSSCRGKKHFPGKASLCSLTRFAQASMTKRMLSKIWQYRVLIVHLCMQPRKVICYHHFLSNKYGIQ